MKSHHDDISTLPSPNVKITDLLHPDYILFCHHVSAENKEITFAGIVDVLRPERIPVMLTHFFLVAAFFRNPEITPDIFNQHEPMFRVIVENPRGLEVDLGTYPANLDPGEKPIVYRLIVDLSDCLQLASEGIYRFVVYGRLGKTRREIKLLTRILPVQIRGTEISSLKY